MDIHDIHDIHAVGILMFACSGQEKEEKTLQDTADDAARRLQHVAGQQVIGRSVLVQVMCILHPLKKALPWILSHGLNEPGLPRVSHSGSDSRRLEEHCRVVTAGSWTRTTWNPPNCWVGIRKMVETTGQFSGSMLVCGGSIFHQGLQFTLPMNPSPPLSTSWPWRVF